MSAASRPMPSEIKAEIEQEFYYELMGNWAGEIAANAIFNGGEWDRTKTVFFDNPACLVAYFKAYMEGYNRCRRFGNLHEQHYGRRAVLARRGEPES